MRSREEVRWVLRLVQSGRNDCQIARETGIPRSTVQQWRSGQTPDFDRVHSSRRPAAHGCAVCTGDPMQLPQTSYSYLLGLYLGDGCISAGPRGVYRLRIRVCGAVSRPDSPVRARHGRDPSQQGRPDQEEERAVLGRLLVLQALAPACSRSTDPAGSTNAGSSWFPGSRSWSTSTRGRWSGGCSTPTGAGC
jgi:hypothetical protein